MRCRRYRSAPIRKRCFEQLVVRNVIQNVARNSAGLHRNKVLRHQPRTQLQGLPAPGVFKRRQVPDTRTAFDVMTSDIGTRQSVRSMLRETLHDSTRNRESAELRIAQSAALQSLSSRARTRIGAPQPQALQEIAMTIHTLTVDLGMSAEKVRGVIRVRTRFVQKCTLSARAEAARADEVIERLPGHPGDLGDRALRDPEPEESADLVLFAVEA